MFLNSKHDRVDFLRLLPTAKLCDFLVPKKKRNCPKCGVNLKAYESEATGETIMGTALMKENHAQHRYREVEVSIECTESDEYLCQKKKTHNKR